ncbi:hypothetical protein AAFC00_000929 [Neodothiora populina]|uniref:Uncharacterized protein n=1 Tax=Neodothiora populina TaxID=2781224 RepID=A0ABR3PNA3_9PEZI
MDQALHDVAVTAVGDLAGHIDAKPRNFLIAVLYHDSDSTAPSRGDFMWIKGNSNVNVARVKDVYLKQLGDDNTSEISLRMGSNFPPNDLRLSDLDQFFDRHIVFRAEIPRRELPTYVSDSPDPLHAHSIKSSTSTTSARNPDQPCDLHAAPLFTASATQTYRTPLQTKFVPINVPQAADLSSLHTAATGTISSALKSYASQCVKAEPQSSLSQSESPAMDTFYDVNNENLLPTYQTPTQGASPTHRTPPVELMQTDSVIHPAPSPSQESFQQSGASVANGIHLNHSDPHDAKAMFLRELPAGARKLR